MFTLPLVILTALHLLNAYPAAQRRDEPIARRQISIPAPADIRAC